MEVSFLPSYSPGSPRGLSLGTVYTREVSSKGPHTHVGLRPATSLASFWCCPQLDYFLGRTAESGALSVERQRVGQPGGLAAFHFTGSVWGHTLRTSTHTQCGRTWLQQRYRGATCIASVLHGRRRKHPLFTAQSDSQVRRAL